MTIQAFHDMREGRGLALQKKKKKQSQRTFISVCTQVFCCTDDLSKVGIVKKKTDLCQPLGAPEKTQK